MDFDLSKENIQPLRGGRNVSQLGVALQAQTDMELQRELLQQKGEFERLIRIYNGDDPLENWYNYISWVEQSYPKQGHEGSMVALLEHCLKLFENDRRYSDDRRLCKLCIKYIDLQQNPLELYSMMHKQGLCRGCADLYKAWAYYYEAAGDFQNADRVLQFGKRERAQPFEDLDNAHKSLIFAAGQHIIYGSNERDLAEKRQALTSLHTYRPGFVGSVRVAKHSTPGAFGTASNARPNAFISIYEDDGVEESGAEAGVVSIVSAAKHEVRKENTLKPGPWTTVPVKKRHTVQRTIPNFTVHEDCENSDTMIPNTFATATSENYSNWIVSLTIPEPKDDRMIPMYPKSKVYSEINTEFSLEELRSLRYLDKKIRFGLAASETDQAVHSIVGNSMVKVEQNLTLNSKENNFIYDQLQMIATTEKSLTDQVIKQEDNQNTWTQNSVQTFECSPKHCKDLNLLKFNIWDSPAAREQPSMRLREQGSLMRKEGSKAALTFSPNDQTFKNVSLMETVPAQSSLNQNAHDAGLVSSSDEQQASKMLNFDLWNSLTNDSPEVLINKPSKKIVSKFSIYEQSNILQQEIGPKGSAMKTPFKDLNAEELAETGSRGGMDIAAAAPVDSAKRLPIYDDDSSSSYDKVETVNFGDVTCNTQTFGFNLNVMQVSTPQKLDLAGGCGKEARKQLFTDGDKCDKALSIIFEETKSSGHSSSSSSSNATTKSSFGGHIKQNNMATISEEHNSYLMQNLMANAALRSSLLGDLMDYGHHSKSPTVQINTPRDPSPIPMIPVPADVTPLDFVPSNPFKQPLIDKLLQRVNFPGPHTRGYFCINSIPKLMVRKETISIGSDKYVIEKQLGKGAYGTVFRGVNLKDGTTVAVKMQKPANRWEFYICRELQARLAHHPLRERFMDVRIGYFSDQASILISEFMPCGSLLDVANMVKQKSGRSMKESLCIHFCLEMLKVVQAMHEVHIIHADIKPDNFLVQLHPNDAIVLQLIDFGCSIDMTLFPPDASFTYKVTTEDFVCCEMLDRRPWNYHTDLFCIAATAHVLLFEKYIQLQKKQEHWSISNRLPRYARLDLWNMFFSTLLNQQNGPAESATLQAMLEDSLNHKFDDYHNEIRYLTNILKNR